MFFRVIFFENQWGLMFLVIFLRIPCWLVVSFMFYFSCLFGNEYPPLIFLERLETTN